MSNEPNVLATLPPPSLVHARIGELLRELHAARKLFKLSKEAHERLPHLLTKSVTDDDQRRPK